MNRNLHNCMLLIWYFNYFPVKLFYSQNVVTFENLIELGENNLLFHPLT